MFNSDTTEGGFAVFAVFAASVLLVMIVIGLALPRDSDNFNQDQTSISKLLSFSVKDNSDDQSNHDNFAEYTPEIDNGNAVPRD